METTAAGALLLTGTWLASDGASGVAITGSRFPTGFVRSINPGITQSASVACFPRTTIMQSN
jgi:hypothetical protein